MGTTWSLRVRSEVCQHLRRCGGECPAFSSCDFGECLGVICCGNREHNAVDPDRAQLSVRPAGRARPGAGGRADQPVLVPRRPPRLDRHRLRGRPHGADRPPVQPPRGPRPADARHGPGGDPRGAARHVHPARPAGAHQVPQAADVRVHPAPGERARAADRADRRVAARRDGAPGARGRPAALLRAAAPVAADVRGARPALRRARPLPARLRHAVRPQRVGGGHRRLLAVDDRLPDHGHQGEARGAHRRRARQARRQR